MIGPFDEAAPGGAPNRRDPLVDRTVRLFEYLTSAQLLKSSPILDAQKYEKVVWFTDLPRHPAVSVPIELTADPATRSWSLPTR